jgi:hypothetical protein
MNEKQQLVLHGLLDLTEAEALEVIREYQTLREKPQTDRMIRKGQIERAVKMYTGPTSASGGGCPCCGG